jgi:hypothetical protein
MQIFRNLQYLPCVPRCCQVHMASCGSGFAVHAYMFSVGLEQSSTFARACPAWPLRHKLRIFPDLKINSPVVRLGLTVSTCNLTCADLIDAPGEQRQILLGVDDALQKVHWRQRLKMPRSDLARLCVASLLLRDEGGCY